MEKPKADINKINEIISHIAYANDVIQAAKSKVLLLDLNNIPEGDDLKKKVGILFDESASKFNDIYNIIKAVYTGSSPEEIIHCTYGVN